MHSVNDLVVSFTDFNEHVGRSEELGKKNVTRVLPGGRFVCQMHGLTERKRGRCHSEWVKMGQSLTLCL